MEGVVLIASATLRKEQRGWNSLHCLHLHPTEAPRRRRGFAGPTHGRRLAERIGCPDPDPAVLEPEMGRPNRAACSYPVFGE